MKMLEKGKKYNLTIEIGNKILHYTCEVISIDDNFILIKDKFGDEYNYNKKLILSYSEVQNG